MRSAMENAASHRVSYWRDPIGGMFLPLAARREVAQNFAGDVRCAPFGSMWLSRFRAMPAHRWTLSAQGLSPDLRKYFLHLNVSGPLRVRQCGHDAQLEAGDLVLCDNLHPLTIEHDAPCSLLLLAVPVAQMRWHLPNPDAILGRPLSGRSGPAHTVAAMLDSITRCVAGIDGLTARRIGDSLLQVFAASWQAVEDAGVAESGAVAARRVQVRRHIEQHLCDPSLGARQVARALGMSPRYVHMVFAEQGETVSQYILRRRIEQCARELRDPALRGRTITEIAFRWGFNSSTYFGRAFRARYDMTPRGYRDTHRGLIG